MTIQQIEPSVLFDSNIYLLIGSDCTALIDTGTGFGADATIKSMKTALGGRSLDYVIITHRHYDHVGGLGRIINEFFPKVYAGKDDAKPLREGDSASTLGVQFGGKIDPMDVIDYNEGDKIDLGGHRLVCIETPGHTVGSICVLDEVTGSLFSGDIVFIDGIGNTTYPTGSPTAMVSSLRKLFNIDFNGLYPGHGPSLSKGGKEHVERGLHMMGA